jgi:hypothetical protein
MPQESLLDLTPADEKEGRSLLRIMKGERTILDITIRQTRMIARLF